MEFYRDSWKDPFQPRDLIALSAEPLLIYPTHYLGEPNYISDTEYSDLITEKTDHNSAETAQGPPVHSNADLNAEVLERDGHQEKGPGKDGNSFSSHLPDELWQDIKLGIGLIFICLSCLWNIRQHFFCWGREFGGTNTAHYGISYFMVQFCLEKSNLGCWLTFIYICISFICFPAPT